MHVFSISLCLLGAVPVFAVSSHTTRDLSPIGSSCTTDAECTSNVCWPQNFASGPLICSPAGAGSSCTSSAECLHGCGSDGKCLKYGVTAPGGVCYTNDDCDSGSCTTGNPNFPGFTTCSLAAVGHSCDIDNDFPSDDYVCISHKCSAEKICEPGPSGAQCYSGADCASRTCTPNTPYAYGTCG